MIFIKKSNFIIAKFFLFHFYMNMKILPYNQPYTKSYARVNFTAAETNDISVIELAEIICRHDEGHKKANTRWYIKRLNKKNFNQEQLNDLGYKFKQLPRLSWLLDDFDKILNLSKSDAETAGRRAGKFEDHKNWRFYEIEDILKIDDDCIDKFTKGKKAKDQKCFQNAGWYSRTFKHTDLSLKIMKESEFKKDLCEISDKLKRSYKSSFVQCNPELVGHIAFQNDNIDDPVILKKIKQNLEEFKKCKHPRHLNGYGSFNFLFNKQLQEILMIQDVVNAHKDVYMPIKRIYPYSLHDEKYNYQKSFDKLAQIRSKEQKIELPDAKSRLAKRIGRGTSKFSKEFTQYAKTDPLRDYVNTFSKKNPEMCRYLYENYYLGNYPKTTQQKCLDIAKEFNVFVFLSTDSNADLDYIKEELAQWKLAGKHKTVFPAYISISDIYYIRSKSLATAYFYAILGNNKRGKSMFETAEQIHVKSNKYIPFALRHEMMHVNDKCDKIYGDFNGIKLERNKGILRKKQWFRDEFINSGITQKHTNYAYKNRTEFIAVASERDMSKFSKEFKEVLVKLGMDKWVFKLADNRELLKKIMSVRLK